MSDAFQRVGGGIEGLKGAGCCAQVCACICALSICGVWVTFMAYLGKYAFGNPDPPCWYTYQYDSTNGAQESLTSVDPVT